MRGGKGQCSRNEDLARRSPTVCTPNSAQRSRSNEPQLKAFKRISATLCFQPSKAPPSGSRLALREGGTGPARPFQRCEHGEWQPKGHQWPALGGRDKETSESFSTRQGTCGPSGTTCWRVTPICLEEVMLQSSIARGTLSSSDRNTNGSSGLKPRTCFRRVVCRALIHHLRKAG
nr:uncharacterized protein LOC110364947 isoform X2 [Columba livia]